MKTDEKKWWIKQSNMPFGGFKVKCDKNTYAQYPTLTDAIDCIKRFLKADEVEVEYSDGTIKKLPLK